MRVLLIAYEYPPIVAAQALRWHYLTNELAALGHEVHVLCPSLPALAPYHGTPHANVIEHRVWPGPLVGLAQYLAARGQSAKQASMHEPTRGYRIWPWLARLVRSVVDHVLYPDARSEWYPFARWRLSGLLREHSFDTVISSHEPGVDILLGFHARKTGIRWLVDLADPLCAPYAPKWRRRLDRWVEHRTISSADRVILTTANLREVLMQRHHLSDATKFVLIPQGGPVHDEDAEHTALKLPEAKLNIVFTGNFYSKFRNPENVAKALMQLASPDIFLTIAGENDAFKDMFAGLDNVRFFGKLAHHDCLALQRKADILLNIGNEQTDQVPGKIYEYLAAGQHVLHISASPNDQSAALLNELDIGSVVANDPGKIADVLRDCHVKWREGHLHENVDLIEKVIGLHSWRTRGLALQAILST